MIRQAETSDLTAIVSVQADNGYNSWSESQLEQTLQQGSAWLLEHDDEVIGFALFSKVLDEAELLNIVLQKKYQGKGIATGLLAGALKALMQENISQCFLEVGEKNSRALKLYHSLGFQIVGKRDNYYKNDTGSEAALMMKLQLIPQTAEAAQ